MITAQIKIHDEPTSVVTYYGGNNTGYPSTYKPKPTDPQKLQQEIDDELLRYIEVDLQIGDKVKAKNGVYMEVFGFQTEDTKENPVQYYQGNPCCILGKNINYPNGSVLRYSFAEMDWNMHNKCGARSTTQTAAQIKSEGAAV